MLFNEPKLLKSGRGIVTRYRVPSFSALQRAEIAEMRRAQRRSHHTGSFSALQRAEIAEIVPAPVGCAALHPFQCSSTSRNC